MFRTAQVELDHLDILNLISMVERRIAEGEAGKDTEFPDSIPNMLIDEALEKHRATLARLQAADAGIRDEASAARAMATAHVAWARRHRPHLLRDEVVG